MANILETVKEQNAAIEYDDPYAGAPYFSDEMMSAKIEKSPVLIMKKPIENDDFQANVNLKTQTESHVESLETSLESTSFEHPEMSSSAISEEKPEETVLDAKCLTDCSDTTCEKEANIELPVDDVCYENFSNISEVCITERKEDGLQTIEALADISVEAKKRLSFHSESGQEEVHDYDDPDTAIYDAPWDLGALQKGLEEKLMINKHCPQESGAFRSDGIPRLVSQGQRDLGLLPTSLTKIMPPPAAVTYQNRNSPETSDDSLKSKSYSGSRHSLKKGSPSRKPDVIVAPAIAEFSRPGFAPMSYLNRPLPTCPAPQLPFVQIHHHQSFPSSSHIAAEPQLLHHPLQRRGIPVMGGGSVGRGVHQPQKVVTAPMQQADWRPLEDYDSPWDNKQRDLISTFNQEPSSLRNSIKKANHPTVPLIHHASLAEKIESRLPLEQEWWYHGPITRQEAEKRLANEREGSYLIRNSESNRLDYSLSIKSSFGCIHLKIVTNNDGRFILGQFSQPFVSVAQMIQHYTVNKLPIKGAEHMSLTFPVGH